MTTTQLESTVQSLLASGKGILAADESFPTIEKRFKALNISSTEENCGACREMLFTTPGLSEFIGGVILLNGSSADGTRRSLSRWLANRSVERETYASTQLDRHNSRTTFYD